MVRVENVRERLQNKQCVLDLQVSTASELPALGANVGGLIVLAGSIAQVIQTGFFFTLDSDGSWYKDGGEDEEDGA